jgi:hypothetical protein
MTEDNRPMPYSLRLTPSMRAELEQIAKANNRSLNAQIIWYLEKAIHMFTADLSKAEVGEELVTLDTEKTEQTDFEKTVEAIARRVVREELARANK